jgi:hypothetical protein
MNPVRTTMRTFADIQQELSLVPFVGSENGSLHCVPVSPGAPRLIVRHFDRALEPSMIPSYVELLAASQDWISADPELSALVRVEQPSETGRDFIARPHMNASSLDAFLSGDPEEDPPEVPDELAPCKRASASECWRPPERASSCSQRSCRVASFSRLTRPCTASPSPASSSSI